MDECDEFISVRSRLEFDIEKEAFVDPDTLKEYEWNFVWSCIRKHKIKIMLQLIDDDIQNDNTI